MNKKRNFYIDILKGLAVFTMVFTHVAVFMYDFSSPILNWFSDFGGDVSYSIFLFCFGVGVTYSILQNPSKKKRKKYLKRGLLWLVLYYLLSILGYFLLFDASYSEVGKILSEIILLKRLVPFTEYFISFAVLCFMIGVFPRVLSTISENFLFLNLFGVVFYMLGSIVYQIVNKPGVAGVFVGFAHRHYFPIFWYLIIFMLGIFTAKFFSRKEKLSKVILRLFIYSILITIGASLVFNFSRFPPSLYFIYYGISWIYGILLLLVLFKPNLEADSGKTIVKKVQRMIDKKEFKVDIFEDVGNWIAIRLNSVGQNVLGIFVIHLLILFGYKYFIDKQFASPFIIIGAWLALIYVSKWTKIKV